jgi:hypothetical protein
VFETEGGTEAQLDGAFLLSQYPKDDQPIIVNARGEVILTVGEWRAEQDRVNRHKKLMDSAASAFGSDEDKEEDMEEDKDDEDKADETDKNAASAKAELPALVFASKRASIVASLPDKKKVNKAAQSTKGKKGKSKDKADFDLSDLESDPQKVKKLKSSKSLKSKTETRTKKRPRGESNDASEPDAADDENEQSTSAKKVRRE